MDAEGKNSNGNGFMKKNPDQLITTITTILIN